MSKVKEMFLKMLYWVGYGIGRVLGLFVVGKRKKDSGQAVIQCSRCGSKRIKLTSTIAEEDIKDPSTGIEYTLYSYAVKCMDCKCCATFKEKWEKEANPDRIYLNMVDSAEGQVCPYCNCKDLIEADKDETITVKLPDGFKLYMCKKCGMPVCVTCDDEKLKLEIKGEVEKGKDVELKAESKDESCDDDCCHCEHCHCHDEDENGEDDE